MSEQFIVTQRVVIEDTEYTAAPGVLYEISPGVVAEMQPATELLIERFEEAAWKGPEREEEAEENGQKVKRTAGEKRTARQAAYDQAAIVLRVVGGTLDLEREKSRFVYPVAARVSQDFFTSYQERPSRQLKSWMEERAREMALLQAGRRHSPAPTDASSSGQPSPAGPSESAVD